MLVISCLILAAVSLVTPARPEEKTKDYTWRREYWMKGSAELEGKPWYLNYRYLSAGLFVITAAMVIWWW